MLYFSSSMSKDIELEKYMVKTKLKALLLVLFFRKFIFKFNV